MNAYTQIERCRLSRSTHLVPVLDLGHQALTGVFPRSSSEKVTTGPLELVWCPVSGLLQLRHTYDPDEMYGENYGYRSGLNQSMVDHLTNKVRHIERLGADTVVYLDVPELQTLVVRTDGDRPVTTGETQFASPLAGKEHRFS